MSRDEPASEAQADACMARHRRAQAELRALRLLAAGAALRECLDPRCSPVLREDCARLLAEVERDVPSVVLVAESSTGDLANVEVYDGEQRVATTLDGSSLQLDPGEHHFTFKAEGWLPASRSVVLRVGEHLRRVAVQLTPVPALAAPTLERAPTPPERKAALAPSNRALTYGLLGGGAALGVAGVWLGLSAQRAYDDAERDCAPLCQQSVRDDIRKRSLVADGLVLLSGAALVWGGVRLLTLHGSRTTTVSLGPNQLIARGRF